MVTKKLAGSKTAGQLCSICQTSIIMGEAIVSCPACDLSYHDECWEENRGCAQYGCTEAPDTIKNADAPVEEVAWGGEKKCPACGRKIKAKAVKCRHCGTDFNTRAEISRDQFASREYTKKELSGVRFKVFLFFVLSVLGPLAWLGGVFYAILVIHGKFAGIDFKRLPGGLKAVCHIGLRLSMILTVLLILLIVLDS